MSKEFTIKRLLVAFDSSTNPEAAATAGAAIARKWEIELCGLFLEDDSLRRLVELQVGGQIGLLPPGLIPLDPIGLDAQVTALAVRAEEFFREVAAGAMPFSFRMVGGDPFAALQAETQEGDLLVTPSATRALTRYAHLSSRIGRFAGRVRCPVLVVGERQIGAGPTVVLHEPGTASGRALAAAERLSEIGHGLDILLAPGAESDETAIRAALKAAPMPVRYWHIKDLAQLPPTVLGGAGALVVDASSKLCASTGVAELVERFHCAVLVVNS